MALNLDELWSGFEIVKWTKKAHSWINDVQSTRFGNINVHFSTLSKLPGVTVSVISSRLN